MIYVSIKYVYGFTIQVRFKNAHMQARTKYIKWRDLQRRMFHYLYFHVSDIHHISEPKFCLHLNIFCDR